MALWLREKVFLQKLKNMKTLKKLMAYFYMPLIFTALGYGLLWIATAPVIQLATNIGSMIIAQDVPDFNNELGNVFVDNGHTLESQPETISSSGITLPAYGDKYGEITCDRIGLNAPVYFGDDNNIIRNGAGQYIGTFLPGFGRTIMLCSHNTTFFKPLQFVEVGDIITFKTSYGVYQYQVSRTDIKDHNDSSAYNLLQEKEELIMYTCYPFETMVGTKTDRLFVYCEKIAGPTVVD